MPPHRHRQSHEPGPRTSRRHAETTSISWARGSASSSSLPFRARGREVCSPSYFCGEEGFQVHGKPARSRHNATRSLLSHRPNLVGANRDSREHSIEWRQLMWHALAIFHAASARHDVWNPACEWGAAFLQSFTPPYVSVVLPACSDTAGELLYHLKRHREALLETVQSTGDAETVKEHLVRLRVLVRSVTPN